MGAPENRIGGRSRSDAPEQRPRIRNLNQGCTAHKENDITPLLSAKIKMQGLALYENKMSDGWRPARNASRSDAGVGGVLLWVEGGIS